MAYITSRSFDLPTSIGEMSRLWFNLWSKKLWPYKELQLGETLWWYESPSARLRWKTNVTDVEAFPYARLEEAILRLEETSGGSIDREQAYLAGKPNQGYCLAYSVEAVKQVDVPKPKGFRFNQNGWERDTRPEIVQWLRRAR